MGSNKHIYSLGGLSDGPGLGDGWRENQRVKVTKSRSIITSQGQGYKVKVNNNKSRSRLPSQGQ